MIIGLTGRMGAGKDTAGAHFVNKYNFERRAFADPLKESIAALFDITVEQINEYKLNPKVFVEIGEYASDDDVNAKNIAFEFVNQGITFREFLQRYGTESHRDVFGLDFWLDAALPLEPIYRNKNVVVTDVRFDNEARRVKDIGGIVVEIVRPGIENDEHRSEQRIFPPYIDFVVYNDRSLEAFYEALDVLYRKISVLN